MREPWRHGETQTQQLWVKNHTELLIYSFRADLDPDADLLSDLCDPQRHRDKAERGESEQYHY